MIDRLKNLVRKAKSLDKEELEVLRYFVFGVILVNIFGIYWYFGLKRLGMAFLMVALVFLGIIILLERRCWDNMSKKEKKEAEKKEKENAKAFDNPLGDMNLENPLGDMKMENPLGDMKMDDLVGDMDMGKIDILGDNSKGGLDESDVDKIAEDFQKKTKKSI